MGWGGYTLFTSCSVNAWQRLRRLPRRERDRDHSEGIRCKAISELLLDNRVIARFDRIREPRDRNRTGMAPGTYTLAGPQRSTAFIDTLVAGPSAESFTCRGLLAAFRDRRARPRRIGTITAEEFLSPA